MSRPGTRTAARCRGLTVPLALAVMLMHIVIAGPTATAPGHTPVDSGHAGHHAVGSSSEPVPGSGPVLTPAATIGEAPTMSGADCGDHDHACVFTRAADVDLPAAVLVLLVWAFLSLSVAGLRHPAVSGAVVLGRPPPWAIRTHLQLQVIRC